MCAGPPAARSRACSRRNQLASDTFPHAGPLAPNGTMFDRQQRLARMRELIGRADRGGSMSIKDGNLLRWSGGAAIIGGACYLLVGLFHPLNIQSSVITATWLVVHIL